jgi:hypothetical protein
MSPPQPLAVLGCHFFSVCFCTSQFQHNGIAAIVQVRVRREANFPGLGLETFSDSHGQKVFFLDGELMTACIAIACTLRTVLVLCRAIVAHTHTRCCRCVRSEELVSLCGGDGGARRVQSHVVARWQGGRFRGSVRPCRRLLLCARVPRVVHVRDVLDVREPQEPSGQVPRP